MKKTALIIGLAVALLMAVATPHVLQEKKRQERELQVSKVDFVRAQLTTAAAREYLQHSFEGAGATTDYEEKKAEINRLCDQRIAELNGGERP